MERPLDFLYGEAPGLPLWRDLWTAKKSEKSFQMVPDHPTTTGAAGMWSLASNSLVDHSHQGGSVTDRPAGIENRPRNQCKIYYTNH